MVLPVLHGRRRQCKRACPRLRLVGIAQSSRASPKEDRHVEVQRGADMCRFDDKRQ